MLTEHTFNSISSTANRLFLFVPIKIYSKPETDPHLSDYERNLFELERKAEYRLEAEESSEQLVVIPPKFSFKTIFTSAPVWASLVTKFSSGLGYYVITTKIPGW